MKQNTKPLRIALFGNAVFSAVSAIVLIMFPEMAGSLIGTTNHILLMVIGIGLGVFSLDLFHQASRQRMQTWRALYSSLGDATWVLGTVILLIWFPNLVSEKGRVLLICIALVVAIFGALQLWGAGETHRLKGTKLYRHCVAVTVPETVDKMWEAVSDLSGISQYFPALRSSTIRDGAEPQVGVRRTRKSGHGRAKLSYGGGVRERDRRSWIGVQG
jgi:hypothetical protein